MELIDHHGLNTPRDELQQIADVLERVVQAEADEKVRDVWGDGEALQEAVERVEAYTQFRPDRFDWRTVNRSLPQYAEGNEEWRRE